ncbi:hypothetical protein SAMN02799630_05172 [Paenibacillus sp. UNCCL117]|uniref:hypothetical protein n=1 Tax=unclassified Paenibacillus TaxID=185978 RepID=UPI00088E752C|nr:MULTISPECIES: hypothetical protein [unclassified Paenibacillus]SDE32777.1 hypothetical protein SAMN04488602_12517 [Paenibacillus sp. cl123]SFW63869.1 hypothetical protein SAMN02799630_05172 [Paenibacillus sp. UNCCL117]
MNNHKNPTIAFILSMIPGFGQFYVGHAMKGMFFGGAFAGALALAMFLAVIPREPELALGMLFIAFLVWIGSVFDMVRTLSRYSFARRTDGGPQPWRTDYGPAGPRPQQEQVSSPPPYSREREAQHGLGGSYDSYESYKEAGYSYPAQPYGENNRYFTIFLSLIPGLGHFHLGLMQRGLAFLALFFGLGIITVFLTAMTNQDDFLVLLGGLPIIWLYAMFDCVQLLNKRDRGDILIDRTFFEDFQEGRESGKKNKTIALLLSIFPGAGHMYLGLQKRGLQFMAAFLFSVYFLDALRLSLFLFLIPILWFYSFFDALQQISRSGREPLVDTPLVEWLAQRQRWIGFGLLALGLYYLVDQILLNTLDLWLTRDMRSRVLSWYHNYFQTFIVSVLLIGGGFRLLWGGKRTK